MTAKLVRRKTQRYDLPLAEGMELLHPELVVLNVGTKTIDIGQLCYRQRLIPTVDTRSSGRLVVLESLCRVRVEHVRKLISHISSVVQYSSHKPLTLHSRFTRLIAFFNWAEVNGWPNIIFSAVAAGPAFRAYAAFIRDRVARNDLSLNAGATQQLRVAEALGELFDIEDFGRGLNLLKKDAQTAEVTVPPCEVAQGRVLGLCEALYTGLSSLVLNKESYPYALAMPKYLDYPNDSLWVFPATSWFKTPAMLAKSDVNAGYHYAEGRLATSDEVQAEYPVGKTQHRWQDVLRDARQHIVDGNADFNHGSRWRLASQALNVYLVLFLAATGMNWAQAINLSWSDQNYEVEATRQGFRTIKWRAGGKRVSFELPVASLPAFRRFLELRRFLLQERQCEHLFFKSVTVAHAPRPYVTNLHGVYVMLRRLDPTLSKIMPREWRAAKSDWLVRNTDPSTAALVLQNTEKTVLRSYAEGSETVHHEELGNFLSQVASAVIARGAIVEGGTLRAVGVCASFGAPKPVVAKTIPIVPDCRGAEGCLFCDKLRVHADERDTRKLLSCRYCINLTAPTSGSFEGFQEVLQPVLDQIDKMLSEIADRDPEMVGRVTREVDEDGELDPYWASKAEMMMSLGI